MSGSLLSTDAVTALVDAARERRAPEEAAAPSRKRRVRTVDFNRPTKFTPEQERRLRRTLEDFCRTASSRLVAETRVPLELEVLSLTQLAWADAHAQVPGESIAAQVHVSPAGLPMLLCLEQALVLAAIELLLGSDSAGDVPARRLTDIDWALGRHFVDRLVAQLAPVWADALELGIELRQLESHLDTLQVTQVSEPTLMVTMEARVQGASSTMTLLIPWTVFAPVADRFERHEEQAVATDAAAIASAVGQAEMTVRAEVGATRLALHEVLTLQPGDLIRLDARVADGVTLYAGEVPIHAGRPGASNGRRAAQVLDGSGS